MAPPKGYPRGTRLRVIGGKCKRGHELREDTVYYGEDLTLQCAECALLRHRVNARVNREIRKASVVNDVRRVRRGN